MHIDNHINYDYEEEEIIKSSVKLVTEQNTAWHVNNTKLNTPYMKDN